MDSNGSLQLMKIYGDYLLLFDFLKAKELLGNQSLQYALVIEFADDLWNH